MKHKKSVLKILSANSECFRVSAGIAPNVKLSEMITRTRYDSQLLDKHLDKTNLVMDALYEIFPLINEINDKLIELSVEQLKEILAMVEKPSRIVHLLEKGHKIVKGGTLDRKVIGRNGKEYVYAGKGSARVVGFVQGTHFVERTYLSTSRHAMKMMQVRALVNCMNAAERARKRAEKAALKATA